MKQPGALKCRMEDEEMKLLKNISSKLTAPEEKKSECDLFGELIATELKTLNQKQFLLAKYEIQNVIFKIRMQALEHGSYSMFPPGASTPNLSTPVMPCVLASTTQYQPFQPQQATDPNSNKVLDFLSQIQDVGTNN